MVQYYKRFTPQLSTAGQAPVSTLEKKTTPLILVTHKESSTPIASVSMELESATNFA